MNDEGLADAAAANPFVYPDFTQELVRGRPTLLRPPRRDRCRPDRIFPVLSERACVGSGRRHLGRGPVSDEPRAPNPAKHSRVQDASKRLDRDQVRSREPGNGDHVYPPSTDGTRSRWAPVQCRRTRVPWYYGSHSAPRRGIGTAKERTNGSAGGNLGVAAIALRQPRQQRVFGPYLHVVPAEHASEQMS